MTESGAKTVVSGGENMAKNGGGGGVGREGGRVDVYLLASS